jgi:hypothetical protein
VPFFYLGKAIYAHTGRTERELSMGIGDEVIIFRKIDNYYYYGYHYASDQFGDVVSLTARSTSDNTKIFQTTYKWMNLYLQ